MAMKFKVIDEGFDRDIEPLEEDQLQENDAEVKSLIRELSNRNYRVHGFWDRNPIVRDLIIKYDGINPDDYEVHHISGVHNFGRVQNSNTSTNLVLVNKKSKLHRTFSKEYVQFVKEFLDRNKYGFGSYTVSDPVTRKLLESNELRDITHLYIQKLLKAGISVTDVFKIDVSPIIKTNKRIPMNLARQFLAKYIGNPNVIPFTSLIAHRYIDFNSIKA